MSTTGGAIAGARMKHVFHARNLLLLLIDYGLYSRLSMYHLFEISEPISHTRPICQALFAV